MLLALTRKELLTNLLTARLGLVLVFAVLLCGLAALAGSLDFSQRVKDYEEEVRRVGQQLEEATIYAEVRPHVVGPPEPLSIFSRGVDKGAGQRLSIQVSWVSAGLDRLGSADNRLMKRFVEIDFATVVRLLLSFMAVILGFDAICGDRERGTLRLMLANPVSRGAVVGGKLLGGALSLCGSMAVAFLFALLILSFNPDIAFSGQEWVRLAVLLGVSCLFLVQVFAMSLAVSAFVRGSATSLMLCLFGWLTLNLGYGNVLPALSRYGVQEHTFQDFLNQNRQVRAEVQREMEEWETKNPPPPEIYLRDISTGARSRYGHPRGYAWRQRRNARALEQHLDASRRINQLQQANYAPLAREATLVDDWSILSPFTNYQTLTKQLARTTLAHKFRLREAGYRYRTTFIDFLRGREAFSSRRWFSDDPPEQEPLLPDPEALTPAELAADSPFMKARMAWVRQQEAVAARPGRGLDLSDLPAFDPGWREPLSETLRHMAPGLLVMVLVTGAAVMLAVFRFLRYDPS